MLSEDRQVAEVMACMPYGLYIVGSIGSEGQNGMMGDWIMQVSFTPRLLAIALENDAQTLANIRTNCIFSINFLSESPEGMSLARQFGAPFRASKIGGPAALGVHPKLKPGSSHLSPLGAPILNSSMAWLECEASQFVPTGDHTLVIAGITAGCISSDGAPLTTTFTGWTYSG